ncbi:MAG: class I SAM-dependent methyltransferase [Microcoleaceae cyanobacterium]
MSLIYPEILNPALQDFFQDQLSHPHQFNSIIHSTDEMYQVALLNQKTPQQAALRYYFNGKRIFDAVSQVIQWHFGDFNTVSSFLDFASGYGRFTRFLTQSISPDKIWISEIHPTAVAFQTQQFGVNGIPSYSQSDRFHTDRQFDAISAISLFSHLPEETFSLWLKKLYDLLTRDGILMFSVHDRSLLPDHAAIATDEILFIPESESQSLDKFEYGTSYVGEVFVNQAIQNISDNQAIIYRIPQGICRYQDLYLVTKKSIADFSGFQFRHHPHGRLEQCYLTDDNNIQFEGFVSEINSNCHIEKIIVLKNSQNFYQYCPDFTEDSHFPNIWSFTIKESQINLKDSLVIKAINSCGLEWVFEAADLELLLKTKTKN